VKRTLVDAGPIVALFDRNDLHHEAAIRLMNDIDGQLVTSWPVMTEVCHLLKKSQKAVQYVLTWIDRGAVNVMDVPITEVAFIREQMARYANLPMDLADATLMNIAEREGITDILSFDHHFDVYRLANNRPLNRIS
jgi:predicted nucleic acid-binding protein